MMDFGRVECNLAATLRQLHRKAININEFKPVEAVDKLPHEEQVKFEQDRTTNDGSVCDGMRILKNQGRPSAPGEQSRAPFAFLPSIQNARTIASR